MGRLRVAGRWIIDYRNWLTFCAVVLVSLIAVGVIHNFQVTGRAQRQAGTAVETAKQANIDEEALRSAATSRNSQFLAQIAELQTKADANGAQIAELTAQVVALRSQVEQSGRTPVVPAPSTTTTTTAPVRTTTTTTAATPSSSTTTSTTAAKPTTTTTACRVRDGCIRLP